MSASQPLENQLLKQVLEPLLEDFHHWFSRSRSLLESENIPFLTDQEQDDLLARLSDAQQQVSTAKMLFQATGGKVGIDTAALVPWHKLVVECWQIAAKWRSYKKQAGKEYSQDSEPTL